MTHDSIGVGEDGPTHEPIEQLASLRAMPGLTLVRPADANETAQAWRLAVEADGPVGLILSRQDVPVLDHTAERAPSGVERGGYVLVREGSGRPHLILIGTGSEVQLCVGAAEILSAQGISTRVVSLPCWSWFENQSVEYRAEVIEAGCRRSASKPGRRLGGVATPTLRRPRSFRGFSTWARRDGEVRL